MCGIRCVCLNHIKVCCCHHDIFTPKYGIIMYILNYIILALLSQIRKLAVISNYRLVHTVLKYSIAGFFEPKSSPS